MTVRDARAQKHFLNLFGVEQQAVSDEDLAMIITRMAMPRRTFLRGIGAAGSSAARRHGAVDDGLADAGQAGPPPRLRLHADGMRPSPVDFAGDGRLTELSPTLQSLAPVADHSP